MYIFGELLTKFEIFLTKVEPLQPDARIIRGYHRQTGPRCFRKRFKKADHTLTETDYALYDVDIDCGNWLHLILTQQI